MLKCDDRLLSALRTVIDDAWEARNQFGGDGCVWGENILASIVAMFEGKVIRPGALLDAYETLRDYAPIEHDRDDMAHSGIAQTMRAVDIATGTTSRYALRARNRDECVFTDEDVTLKKFESSSLGMAYNLTRVRTIELFVREEPVHGSASLGVWQLR